MLGEDDDDWERTRILAATVEDHELLDPTLPPERLLYRLFHEEGVRALPPAPDRGLLPLLARACRCVPALVRRGELADMREPDGAISVTCEFCTTNYRFAPDEID